MPSIGWLPDASEESLHSALEAVVPEPCGRPVRIAPTLPSSKPLWSSTSAVIDETFVVKYAWSPVRAERLWREGVVLQKLRLQDPSLTVPEVVAVSSEPALVVTRIIAGAPLSSDWADGLTPSELDDVAYDLAAFLVRLHACEAADVLVDLPVVVPTAQADTARLRARFPRLVDERRGGLVQRWCDWVDDVLNVPSELREVVVHGDLHGYNQLWDHMSTRLLAVVDFEESGAGDPHFDLRYLPGIAARPDLAMEVMGAYERLSGRRLELPRVMAWNVLTVLGDALWRTEVGVPLPGGGSAPSWVDDLATRLRVLELG